MKIKNFKNGKLAASLLATSIAIAGLSGCSSSSNNDKTPPPEKTIAVDGVAAKGILQKAVVEACLFADCSNDNDPIVSTTTDDKGEYALNIPASNAGTLVIRVSAGEDSKMICETKDCFGESIKMPSDLKLRTVTSVEASSTIVSAHISPITELVTVAAVKSKGGSQLNSDAVKKANTTVRKILGIDDNNADAQDLTKVKPIDITKADADVSNDLALQLSLVSAAFADTSEGESIADKINTLTTAITTGSVDKTVLESINDKAKSALNTATTQNTNSKLAEKKGDISQKLEESKQAATKGCGDTCGVEVEQAEITQDEQKGISANVKAVKDLVGDVREIGWSIYPQIRDALDEDSDKLDKDNIFYAYEQVEDIVNDDTKAAIEGLGEITGYLAMFIGDAKGITGDLAGLQPSGNKISFKDIVNADNGDGNKFTGDIVIVNNNNWTVTGATYTLENDKKVTVSLKASLTGADDLTKLQDIKIELTDVSASYQDKGKATISLTKASAAAKTTKQTSKDAIESDDNNSLNGVYFESVSIAAQNAVVSHEYAQITRKFTGSFSVSAKSSAAIQQKNPNNVLAIMLESISLDGRFEANGSFIEAKATAKVNNWDKLDPILAGTELTQIPVTLTKASDKKSV